MNETELAERFVPMADEVEDDRDWLDVRRRARALGGGRPERRRRTVLAVALAAAVALPALAWAAVATDLIPGFQGEPAPPEVQANFARLATGDFPQAAIARGVKPSEARGVLALRTEAGTVRMWVAPTETGERCRLLTIGDAAKEHAFTCNAPLVASPVQASFQRLETAPGLLLIDGEIGPQTTSVGIQLRDGSERPVPTLENYFAAVVEEADAQAIVIHRGEHKSTFPLPKQ